jgi:hypothetical protein
MAAISFAFFLDLERNPTISRSLTTPFLRIRARPR